MFTATMVVSLNVRGNGKIVMLFVVNLRHKLEHKITNSAINNFTKINVSL